VAISSSLCLLQALLVYWVSLLTSCNHHTFDN
jgi:hypothetical protein